MQPKIRSKAKRDLTQDLGDTSHRSSPAVHPRERCGVRWRDRPLGQLRAVISFEWLAIHFFVTGHDRKLGEHDKTLKQNREFRFFSSNKSRNIQNFHGRRRLSWRQLVDALEKRGCAREYQDHEGFCITRVYIK